MHSRQEQVQVMEPSPIFCAPPGLTVPPGLSMSSMPQRDEVPMPNPWLWPSDARGTGFPQMQHFLRQAAAASQAVQAAQAVMPNDQPMKIPVYAPQSAEAEADEAVAGNENVAAEAYWAGGYTDPAFESLDAVTGCGFEESPEAHGADHQPKNPKDQGGDFGQCRWHRSAETVGVISEDGHVFTKTAGPRRCRVSDRGARVELASICMVFDASLRCGGVHRYCYQIMEGELGAADGAGFVFDSKVRRNNIQRMRSVFLNQRGRICLRNNQQVTKLQAQLPPLTVGVCLTLLIDLDSMMARFNVSNAHGVPGGSADVSLEGLFDLGAGSGQLRSGFFCAVVTGNITIGIH